MFFIYFWASPLWDFVYDFSFRFGGTISTLQVHRKAPKERVCVFRGNTTNMQREVGDFGLHLCNIST